MTLRGGRRDRLAQVISSRRRKHTEPRAGRVRLVALSVVALTSLASGNSVLALGMTLSAGVAVILALLQLRSPQHSPWTPALVIFASVVVVVVPCRVSTDLPVELRLVALAGAVAVVTSVATSLFTEPAWFDPTVNPHWWLELLRVSSGPFMVVVTALVTVPSSWPAEASLARWVLTGVPLLTSLAVADLDRILRSTVPLVRAEGQRGRDQVLREIHGALSTQLRQLEQYARDYRLSAPALYELAVNANSALRETLTLAEEGRDTSTTPDSIEATIRTLTRAEGASATTWIGVAELSRRDREIARFVLHELVGNALRAGASHLDVSLDSEHDHLKVSVVDDAGQMPADTWKRPGSGSAQLNDKLASLSGGLSSQPDAAYATKTVSARWAAERQQNDQPDPHEGPDQRNQPDKHDAGAG